MLAISNLLFRDGDRRFGNRAETAQKQRFLISMSGKRLHDGVLCRFGDAYFFDIDVGGKRVRDAAFFLTIMFVTFAATLLKPQNYVSSRTIRKCVEQVSTSTEP